jgi:hypothetical protein
MANVYPLNRKKRLKAHPAMAQKAKPEHMQGTTQTCQVSET